MSSVSEASGERFAKVDWVVPARRIWTISQVIPNPSISFSQLPDDQRPISQGLVLWPLFRPVLLGKARSSRWTVRAAEESRSMTLQWLAHHSNFFALIVAYIPLVATVVTTVMSL